MRPISARLHHTEHRHHHVDRGHPGVRGRPGDRVQPGADLRGPGCVPAQVVPWQQQDVRRRLLGEQHHHLHRHRGRHLAHPHQDHVRGRLVVQLLEAVVELIKSGEIVS